jgi:hypothetical protein
MFTRPVPGLDTLTPLVSSRAAGSGSKANCSRASRERSHGNAPARDGYSPGTETFSDAHPTYCRPNCTSVSVMSTSQNKLLAALLAGTAALSASLTGCAGNGAGLDAEGLPISSSSGSGGTVPLTADFESIQENVFTPICSPCHSGASAPEGLMLDAAHSYNLLVGVPSAEVPTLDRVKPGDPDDSYIILKLQDSPGIVGSQMPLHETPLPQSTIDLIRQWITNGAPEGTTSTATAVNAMQKIEELAEIPSSTPFAVTETSPADQALVERAVTHIVVAFNHEVDSSLINYTTLRVERVGAAVNTEASAGVSTGVGTPAAEPSAAVAAGSEQSSGDAPPLGIGQSDPSAPTANLPSYATLAEGNSNVIVITPLAPLLPGTYRVTVRGSGGGALADLNAQALGSDYSFTFTVDASP